MKEQDSLVLELQRLASERANDISDLLRKAKLVCGKLALKEFGEWVDLELNGYYGKSKVPSYRIIFGKISLKNPYHGLIPVIFPDSESAEPFCRVECRDPIGNLVHIIENHDDSKTDPIMRMQPELEAFLMREHGSIMPPIRTVSPSTIATIVDAVRNNVLEWSLKLESAGILGNGMSFSAAEKQKAAASGEIRINNFQGILGNVNNSTIDQHLDMKVQKGDIQSLRSYLKSQNISDVDIQELESAIKSDPVPSGKALGTRVASWIGKMISKAASGAWDVGVGVAGNLLSAGILKYYGIG